MSNKDLMQMHKKLMSGEDIPGAMIKKAEKVLEKRETMRFLADRIKREMMSSKMMEK